MATTKKNTTAQPAEPGGELPAPTAATVGDEAPEVVQAAPVELESDSGGVFVNAGQVDLVLLQPAVLLKPGQVIELEYDPGHRDLHRATPAQITAARDAEAAEQADAEPSTTNPGQEQ